MYQVIARKYRPANFSELIGQEHVRTTLENAITQRRIAHGYILSGQRGTGKTTVARIIARCLNCINGPTPQPCGECASCREIASGGSVDVIEIDAASNRGINEMRELRDNVRYRPARDRYKVFIVDEAHQITSEAFNALLKTLEEPPEWVVFILCTTEVHKIPVTIASRCQQFSFRSVDFDELVTRMRWICEQEGIQANDEVLAVIAQVGEGSVRDSLSALDQAIACCGETLDASGVRSLLGLFSLESLQHVADALARSDSQRMLEIVQELERNGRVVQHFCRELSRFFRNLLVARIVGAETRLIAASAAEQERLRETAMRFSEEDLSRYLNLTLELYNDMQFSLQPRLHLEMGLLRLVHAGRLGSIEEALGSLGNLPAGAAKPVSKPAAAPAPVVPPPAPLRSGPSPFERDAMRKQSAPAAPPPSAALAARIPEPLRPATARPEPPPREPAQDEVSQEPARQAVPERASPDEGPQSSPSASDARTRLLQALVELGFQFTADGVEHSDVAEAPGEIVITASVEYKTSLTMSEGQLRRAVEKAWGRPLRVKIVAGTPAAKASASPTQRKVSSQSENEVMERALSDPAVQKFREAFPDAEVRQVRNLRD